MSKIKYFDHGGKHYRLIGRTVKEYEYGYAEPAENTYNVLQVKVIWWWKDVEKEFVPSFVVISLACLGDTGGWFSELQRKCRTELGMT